MGHSCGYHCIKIEKLGVTLDRQQILRNVNIHIHCGQLTTIIGPNGAGKSTLIKALIGEIPHEGAIKFRDIRDDKPIKLKIGYVPQQLPFDKNTPSTVYDLFASYISKRPICFFKDKAVYEKAKEQLAVFEADSLIDRTLGDLSGGELQRVMLSIATYPMPNLLVLDEPISGMDRNGMMLFYEQIDRLKKEYDLSILLVSHDLEFAYEYSDKIILLDGTIVGEGTPKEVFESRRFKSMFGNIRYERGEV